MNRHLFDSLKSLHQLRDDASLARKMNCRQADVSKMRAEKRAIGPSMLLRVHETFGVPIKTCREFIAYKREEK